MNLTPKQIVAELDKYIVGQVNAKKAVAVALRNRYRRSKLSEELREEITPKNIIMTGPTGVGKTEIARRLARLVGAPFVKVEATKYTEVGYVGRDVESMIRDLVEVSYRLVKEESSKKFEKQARAVVDKKIINAIFKQKTSEAKTDVVVSNDTLKEKIAEDYQNELLEDEIVELEVVEAPKSIDLSNGQTAEINITEMIGGFFPPKKKLRKLSVRQARELLMEEEENKLIDEDNVKYEALRRAEQEGIIFIDEIDRITSSNNNRADVSREGVQRDILPIVEGSTVTTKYGSIRTDYILFIAAGAFHISKVEDLIPELQGRFPIRVNLENLTKDDFLKILKETKNSLITQYKNLLEVDKINIEFTDDALEAIADMAERENENSENIGARRLNTIMEFLLEDISFNAGSNDDVVNLKITREFVENTFNGTIKQYDLKKYVL